MKVIFRQTMALASWLLVLAAAQAHFVFVVPGKDAMTATVVLSEDLSPDEAVMIEPLSKIKLSAIVGNGREIALSPVVAGHHLEVRLPGKETTTLRGNVTWGVMERTGVKPFLIVYHPKAILSGSGFPAQADKAGQRLEIVPENKDGKTRFQLLFNGKPVPEASGSLFVPGAEEAKLTTDKDGFTPACKVAGRYHLWLRHKEPVAGQFNGKKFDETRHYATLVANAASGAE